MSRVIFNKQTGEMEVMPDPRINPNNFPRSGPFGAIGPKRPYGGMDCPALNEEVLLADNKWIPAKDLKIGDEVATHLGSNKVTHIDVLKDRVKKEVVFSDNNQEESIVTSDSHPYYVQNEEGFVEVKDLKVGDQVGNFKVKEIKDADKGSVVHISIDQAQTYYLKAGDKKVLSHNKSIRQPDKRPTFPSIPTRMGGIPTIPGLENIDFSNLPMGMDFSNFDPIAINANPQGFQDMIEQAQNQQDFPIFGGPAQGPAPDYSTLPEGIDPGGNFFTGPNGERMYSPPMPKRGAGMVGNMMMPPAIDLDTGQPGAYIRGDIPRLDQDRVMPTAPVQTTAPVAQPTAPVQQPLAPYTGSNEPAPYASNVVRTETGMDALTKQLLFGLDGKGGFIPGAMQAAEKTFFNADGTPRVVEEQVAGLSPDQIRAQGLAREGIGIQDPYLQQAGEAYSTGVGALDRGLTAARSRAEQGLGATQRGVSQEEALRNQGLNRILGGVDQFGQRSGSLGRQAMDSTAAFGGRLGESEGLIRGTTGAYDPSLTSQFYNPYEDRVVQQTIDDVFEAGEKQDMAARARDIQTGGESAFGSRARLGASERRESLGRGLGEALGALRSRGFSEAQQTGMGEFARQRDAERAAASGLSGLAGSRLASQQALGSNLQGLSGQQLAAQQTAGSALGGAGQSALAGQQQLAGAFSGLSNLESQIGQQQQQAQFGLGSNLQGLGQQAQTANQAGVGQLYNIGQQQQNLQQQQLDAQRRNQLQAQQAPLAQYQALSPFIQMAPQGQFQAQTTFAPPPSPMQAALTTGLGAFGAIGNFMNPGTRR